MPAYNLIVKGSAKEAIVAAEKRRVIVLRILSESQDKTILLVTASGRQKIEDLYRWFNEGPVDAPFPTGTLLHFNEREEDGIDSDLEPQRGTRITDLDGLSDGDVVSADSWTVSTLKPGLHNQPRFRHRPDEASAITYARNRALHGQRVPGKHEPNLTGRVYFVLNGGNIVYRVFRGLRGEERRKGAHAPEPRREFIIVQRAVEMLPNNKIRWAWEHGLSIEIEDPELVKERARVVPAASKRTLYSPGWAYNERTAAQTRKRR